MVSDTHHLDKDDIAEIIQYLSLDDVIALNPGDNINSFKKLYCDGRFQHINKSYEIKDSKSQGYIFFRKLFPDYISYIVLIPDSQ